MSFEEHYKTSHTFWSCQDAYPNYDFTNIRRMHDMMFISKYTPDARSLLDIGCGDGTISRMIAQLSNIENFHHVDVSDKLLKIARDKWHLEKYATFTSWDVCKIQHPVSVDLAIMLGVTPYIFDDKDLLNVLKDIHTKYLVVRSPCTLKKEDEIINKFSANLNDMYAANYRTIGNLLNIISDIYIIHNVQRSYPDEIESRFGTKQFIVFCEKT